MSYPVVTPEIVAEFNDTYAPTLSVWNSYIEDICWEESDEFKDVVDYIKTYCKPRKTLYWKYTSYGLKHRIEQIRKAKGAKNSYVHNEMVMFAAVLLGYKLKTFPGNPNVKFYWSDALYDRELAA